MTCDTRCNISVMSGYTVFVISSYVQSMQGLRSKKAHSADLQDVHSSSSSVQEDRLQRVAAFVQQHTGAVLVDKLETHLHFKVPTEAEPKLTHFFAQIKVRYRVRCRWPCCAA